MHGSHIVAQRYAKALVQAVEGTKGQQQDIFEQLIGLKHCIHSSEPLQSFLHDPFINTKDKEHVLHSISHYFHPLVQHFLTLIAHKKRHPHLLAICIRFEYIWLKKRGIKKGVVYSAHPLTTKQILSLETKVSTLLQQPCQLNNIIKTKLIAGFTINIDDMVIDKSIAHTLQNIQHDLLT
jgi:F-type H+-transporting ATPase subunit delta